MIDDPVGMAGWLDSDSPEPVELSDRDRRGIIGVVAFLTFVLIAFSVYAGLDTGELRVGLTFGGMSLFVGGFLFANNLDVPTIRDRVRLSFTLDLALRVGGRARRWRAEDWQAAVEASPNPVRYGLGLVHAALLMRLYDLGTQLLRAVRWVLASNHRTWWPLGTGMVAGAVQIHLSQGWGSVFYTIPVITTFYAGVEWLRRRWNIQVSRRPGSASDAKAGGDAVEEAVQTEVELP
ncbi:hypothetical protein ACFYY8_24060 [Streptosporangium sp. NPDC001559]|uniref:hypothetical protein n=1 Tax=Streptosporangium sp. NPDC001559 TaxID=3366187 RepID=UPI0036F1742C